MFLLNQIMSFIEWKVLISGNRSTWHGARLIWLMSFNRDNMLEEYKHMHESKSEEALLIV